MAYDRRYRPRFTPQCGHDADQDEGKQDMSDRSYARICKTDDLTQRKALPYAVQCEQQQTAEESVQDRDIKKQTDEKKKAEYTEYNIFHIIILAEK